MEKSLKTETRREFIRKSALAGLAFSMPAYSYSRILGANEKVLTATAGINSRGNAHIAAAAKYPSKMEIIALCDVDNRTFAKAFQSHESLESKSVTLYSDIRKLLENKDIDAVTIATPDHWHAPMAIMAMNAGKHVYLEKPFSHNPQEGEWLVQVQAKTGKVLQIGNQQRSAPTSIALKKEIDKGTIGRPYYAKAWYSNNRGSIGTGKKINVPEWLNWELWQGPAPRKDYKDNYVHYHWHWFWHWGTGEINNNGLHELDIARWMLGVDFPDKVISQGGRFAFQDDWEFYDTQLASFYYGKDKMITWEGRSCRTFPLIHNRGRGTAIYGTEGSAIVDRDGFEIYNKDGKLIASAREEEKSASTDLVGIGGLDGYHMKNFLDAITKSQTINSPANEAHKSTLMCHLGNMAQRFDGTLEIDSSNGKPKNKQAMSLWGRDYEKGWKPVV